MITFDGIIVHGLPMLSYLTMPALGSTSLREAATRCVAFALVDDEETQAQRIGTMAHAAFLEPTVLEDYVVAKTGQCQALTKSGRGPRCSKPAVPGADHCSIHGGKREAEQWMKTLPPGSQIVTADEKQRAKETADGIRARIANSEYPNLLEDAETEVTIFAYATLIDEFPGYELSVGQTEGSIAVKARLDIAHCIPLSIIDMKGSLRDSIVDPYKWSWRIRDDALHVQAALYSDMWKLALGYDRETFVYFSWLVHTQNKPYAIRFFDADPADLDSGRLLVAEGLRRWKVYLETGDAWEGWPRNRETVEMAHRRGESDE